MPAFTPMKCFRVSNTEAYAEDGTGYRELICTCPNKDQLDFVMHGLTFFHRNTPTLTMHEHPKALAPFTIEQVLHLREYQNSNAHPYTCRNSNHGPLWPESNGWICRIMECNYKQNWAHAEHTGVS